MKRKTTTTTEEFDKDGKLVNRTTESTEEEDSGFIYPQYPAYPSYPWWQTVGSTPTFKPEWIVRPDTTCDSSK